MRGTSLSRSLRFALFDISIIRRILETFSETVLSDLLVCAVSSGARGRPLALPALRVVVCFYLAQSVGIP